MCFITFDDGERCVYEVVYPIIKRLNIPIAMFVSPLNICEGGAFWFQRMRQIAPDAIESMKILSLETICKHINQLDSTGISNTDMNINRKMFDELYASGLVTFGAHTQHHPILANETDEVTTLEIRESVEQLADMLAQPVRYFAYPSGSAKDFSQREIAALKQSGVLMALSTIHGYASADDLYRVKRIGVTRGNQLHVIFKILFPNAFILLKRLK
jgi:peptidoglycan/xylan/chitin deacetylase (PgdA/CDA1 family)